MEICGKDVYIVASHHFALLPWSARQREWPFPKRPGTLLRGDGRLAVQRAESEPVESLGLDLRLNLAGLSRTRDDWAFGGY